VLAEGANKTTSIEWSRYCPVIPIRKGFGALGLDAAIKTLAVLPVVWKCKRTGNKNSPDRGR